MQTKILKEKNIVVGITGGIAAYKIPEVIRILRSYGANVQVIMTKNAQEFITPLTLQTVSGRKVYDQMFEQKLAAEIDHISVARWADAILIAPATVNIIAKVAHGIADDLLTTVCLASKAKIAIAPAMNREMWLNPITQKNVLALQERQMHIFGPDEGVQACGEIGPGRMLEPNVIVQDVSRLFVAPILKHKKIIITAGPTREPIDPVRYISNYSSGKMGYAIAAAAVAMGAEVELISGPIALTIPQKVNITKVNTAQEMLDAVIAKINDCDIFIATAAVADYRSKTTASQKHKKTSEPIMLSLISNPDILSYVAALPNPPLTIGFAAETENLEANALTKLQNKNIDIIAANIVGNGVGFEQDDNELLLLARNGKSLKLKLQSKDLLAYELLDFVAGCHNI